MEREIKEAHLQQLKDQEIVINELRSSHNHMETKLNKYLEEALSTQEICRANLSNRVEALAEEVRCSITNLENALNTKLSTLDQRLTICEEQSSQELSHQLGNIREAVKLLEGETKSSLGTLEARWEAKILEQRHKVQESNNHIEHSTVLKVACRVQAMPLENLSLHTLAERESIPRPSRGCH